MCLAVGLAAFLASCSSVRLVNDYDPNNEFERYDSFDWLDKRPGVTAEANAAGALDAPVRRAVGSELVSKGLVHDATNPDVLVIYHVGEDDGIDTGRWGYDYGGAGKEWGGNVDVRAYRAGTLVVDLIDAATMRLVWRASAEGVFRKDGNPTDAAGRMTEAVRGMLSVYPPSG